MARIDDEKLNALHDGELAEVEAAELRAKITEDAASANRLAQLGEVDALLRSAVDQLDEGVSRKISPQVDAVGKSIAVSLPPSSVAANDNWWRLPLTASVALAVGLLAGRTVLTPGDGGQEFSQIASFDSGSQIGDLLETVSGGEQHSLGSSTLEVRLTFIGRDGSPCREFLIEGATSATQSVACRQSNGRWETQLTAPAPVEVSEPDFGYQTAWGENDAFGQAVSSMMQSDALGAEAETKLIEDGWSD